MVFTMAHRELKKRNIIKLFCTRPIMPNYSLCQSGISLTSLISMIMPFCGYKASFYTH